MEDVQALLDFHFQHVREVALGWGPPRLFTGDLLAWEREAHRKVLEHALAVGALEPIPGSPDLRFTRPHARSLAQKALGRMR